MLFDSDIVIRGSRGTRNIAVPLTACIVDDGVADPFSQANTASDIDALCVYIRRADWTDVEPPQIGDIVTTDDNAQYAVRKVGRLGDVFALSSRRK